MTQTVFLTGNAVIHLVANSCDRGKTQVNHGFLPNAGKPRNRGVALLFAQRENSPFLFTRAAAQSGKSLWSANVVVRI
jgi:hypothetical protein